jgi:hypothetical protein
VVGPKHAVPQMDSKWRWFAHVAGDRANEPKINKNKVIEKLECDREESCELFNYCLFDYLFNHCDTM